MATYHILSELGRGGMGIVFKALQVELQREVALKFLHPEGADDVVAMQRFHDEARELGQLEHPNLVKVYDTGIMEGQPFFAMELLPGKGLATLIHERGALPVSETVPLMAQAADALATIHLHGLIHRDVKPANMIVSAIGHLTLMDLGLVRRIDRTAFTATNQILGTMRYLAPEVIEGAAAGPAADVYAIGLTTLEMLLGRPWTTNEVGHLWEEIVNEVPARFIRQIEDIPQWLADLLRAALVGEPSLRISAADYAARLRLHDAAPFVTRSENGRTGIVVDADPVRSGDVSPPGILAKPGGVRHESGGPAASTGSDPGGPAATVKMSVGPAPIGWDPAPARLPKMMPAAPPARNRTGSGRSKWLVPVLTAVVGSVILAAWARVGGRVVWPVRALREPASPPPAGLSPSSPPPVARAATVTAADLPLSARWVRHRDLLAWFKAGGKPAAAARRRILARDPMLDLGQNPAPWIYWIQLGEWLDLPAPRPPLPRAPGALRGPMPPVQAFVHLQTLKSIGQQFSPILLSIVLGLVTTSPDDARWWFALGRLFELEGRRGPARIAYGLALERAPDMDLYAGVEAGADDIAAIIWCGLARSLITLEGHQLEREWFEWLAHSPADDGAAYGLQQALAGDVPRWLAMRGDPRAPAPAGSAVRVRTR